MYSELIKRLRSYLPLGDGSLWSESSKDIAKASDALESQAKEIDALKAENFALAAGQCCEKIGLSADDGGVIYCKQKLYRDQESVESERISAEYEALVPHLRAELAVRELVIHQMREVLPAFRPQYGAVGSRDVDVAKQIAAYDKAIAIQPSTTHLDAYVAEKVKENDAEIERINKLMLERNQAYFQELAARELVIQQLHAKLEQAIEWNWNDSDIGDYVDIGSFSQVLAISPSTTYLDAYVAESTKEKDVEITKLKLDLVTAYGENEELSEQLAAQSEALNIHIAERDHARTCYERSVRIITGIHALLYPPHFTDKAGRIWRFKSPIVDEQMQELSDRIRAIPDELEKINALEK